ncbi:hypothetical protein ACMSDU_11460 [Bacteroides thetaiotaomicron]|jgi:hypothetical protein bacD2_10762|uniref:Lipoprotein n=1 Tax=Bacteroides thetaiotaomicron TaxID=818 RepID=A0A174NY23_BACT4|nr:hypothetical protein [Bacteroides thetaiotaomicron]MCS2645917.1 hypothetical protein [Bacteroides thetaiotaomicron]CUP53692.1 Uncharacterised protein [Bacteroides thetaiotaomicron]
MKLRVKEMSLLLIVSLFLIFTVGFMYSCGSDEYEFSESMANSNLTKTSSKSISFRSDVVDSIAVSDEFLDFIMCCNMLSDKFTSYISTIDSEEEERWRNNINNSDYMDEFARKANVEVEVELIAESKRKLYNNTAFLTLNETEKSILFFDRTFLPKNTLLKTRSESNSSECEKNRKNAYNAAYSSFYFSVGACGNSSQCLAEADGALKMNLYFADVNYHSCMGNISNK